MPYPAEDIAPLTALISAERLAALNAVTGDPATSILIHQETLLAGAALMAVIATVEIALRNTVYDNLSHHFAAPEWLQRPPVGFRWRTPEASKIRAAIDSAKRDRYAKLDQAGKHALDALAYPRGRPANLPHLTRAKERRKHIATTDGTVVAELTMFFWKRLYGPEYDATLWKPALKRTFPDKNLKRAEVSEKLEYIYQSRNRIAHHEPVLRRRFNLTVEAIEFVSARLGMRHANADSPLARMLTGDLAAAVEAVRNVERRIDEYRR